MTTRREFLAVVGGALGATSLAQAEGPKVPGRPSARAIEDWLLSTAKGKLNPRLLEVVRGQIKPA